MSELDSILPPGNSGQKASGQPPARRIHDLRYRYLDAYRVARTTILFGDIIKALGILAAVVGLVVSLFATNSPPAFGGLVVAFGLVVGVVVFCMGILVSAVGQTLLATLDGTVNSSPFLDIREKAEILGIRSGGDKAEVGSGPSRVPGNDEQETEFCHHCGEELPRGSGYCCPSCGKTL